MHQWEKLFINSKLFTLQTNLTRVHLWGTFASHWRRVARVGDCGLSIKINAGIWLVGDTDTPWQWIVHWTETQFWQYFYFLKKEPRRRCSITVQPCTEILVLHVYKFWVTYPCERRSYASLKSENMLLNLNRKILPLHFLPLMSTLTRFNSKTIAHIDPILFFINIHIVYLKTVPGLFDTPLRWLSMLRTKWKHRKKNMFYTNYEIFPKIKLQLANADTVLGRRRVCIIIKKKKWNR